MKVARELAAQALAITAQDWTCLGFSEDPQVAPSSRVDVITERILSLLAIRCVAVLSTLEDFDDFSTTTICRAILLNEKCWPDALTDDIIQEMRVYVTRIIQGYNDTPYHNREHAYHVTLSCNKLLDLMLNPEIQDNGHERHNNKNANKRSLLVNGDGNHHRPSSRHHPRTFGLRRDTLLQFTLIFAALIHDVQHGGVSNRQLSLEDDPLALLYNDSSVLEQQSLTIAFTEFLQPEFTNLRKAILPTRDIYSGFRQTVVNLVLSTDIANPERMQVTKDKWKTAFGEQLDQNNNEEKSRRESAITEITLPRQNNLAGRESRRRSIGSIFSDITVDANINSCDNLLGALSSADEASLSATPDSSENDGTDGIFGSSAVSGSSAEGLEDISSDGFSGSRMHSTTPDSMGTRSLQKIEESERTEAADFGGGPSKNEGDEVTSQELGYSTAPHSSKQNGNLSPKSEGCSPPLASSMSLSQRSKTARRSRRGSTTNIPDGMMGLQRGSSGYRHRRASISAGDNLLKRMQQRLSATSSTSEIYNGRKFRQRLGIMRSLDLGGETIENFSRKSSICSASKFPLEEFDEPDELRAIVVLETMLLSCDVAHNLQGWDHMLKWSHRLYWELQNANEAGRGFDPSPGWVDGQTGFLQGYMLPLAQKLGGTGVFGKRVGPVFANVVQDILEHWKAQGEEVTAFLISNRELDLGALRQMSHRKGGEN